MVQTMTTLQNQSNTSDNEGINSTSWQLPGHEEDIKIGDITTVENIQDNTPNAVRLLIQMENNDNDKTGNTVSAVDVPTEDIAKAASDAYEKEASSIGVERTSDESNTGRLSSAIEHERFKVVAMSATGLNADITPFLRYLCDDMLDVSGEAIGKLGHNAKY